MNLSLSYKGGLINFGLQPLKGSLTADVLKKFSAKH